MSFIKTMIDQLAKSRLRITLYAIPLRLVNSPSGICVFRASRSSLRYGRRWTSIHWTLSAPQSCNQKCAMKHGSFICQASVIIMYTSSTGQITEKLIHTGIEYNSFVNYVKLSN